MSRDANLRRLPARLGPALVALLPASALAAGADDPYYHGPGMMWGGSGWFMGPVTMLIFVVLAVVLIAFLVRWLGGHAVPGVGAHPGAPSKPLDILKERFARGEIDEEEYQRRKRVVED